MRTVNRLIVGAIITDHTDRILLGKRAEDSPGVYKGCWLAPGGGVESGETEVEALRRELLEEVGLPKSLGMISRLDDHGRGESEKTINGEVVKVDMKFVMYLVEIPESSDWLPTPNSEFATLRWFAKAELAKIELSPPGRELFSRLNWI